MFPAVEDLRWPVAALRNIHGSLPALADELAHLRVKTGTFCVYTPDPAHPTDPVKHRPTPFTV